MKFKVIVHGQKYRVQIVDELHGETPFWRNVGFYATRFAEAYNTEQAIESVFRHLGFQLVNDGIVTTSTSSLSVEEIREDKEAFDSFAPGGGYTFYQDDLRDS